MNKQLSKDTLSIPVMFQNVEQYAIQDTRFAKVKIWLMHTGINENGSSFDRESVMKAIPTLANTPILGYIEKNQNGEDDFSDHRKGFVTKDGERKFVYLGSAYGVIPETNNAHFQIRLCDDGVEREFLVVDGLIWTKLEDGIDILFRDGFKSQSMELDDNDYDGYFDEDGIFHFTHFVFYGACMLGSDVQPAMTDSTVELSFCKDLENEIRNKLEMFNEYTKKESVKVSEQIKDTVTDENVVKTNETNVTEENTEEQKEKTESESNDKVEKEESEEEVEEQVETVEETQEDNDFSKEETKQDEKDYKAEYEALQIEYQKLKTEYTKLETTNSELQSFKDSTLKVKREKQEKELFEKYDSDLSGVEEYESLKTKTTEFSNVTDLEKEIALIFARNAKTSFSQSGTESTRVYFEKYTEENSRYGYLAEKYKV